VFSSERERRESTPSSSLKKRKKKRLSNPPWSRKEGGGSQAPVRNWCKEKSKRKKGRQLIPYATQHNEKRGSGPFLAPSRRRDSSYGEVCVRFAA